MDVTCCFDECEKISELARMLSEIDCKEAGRRFTKSYWEVQYLLDDTTCANYKLGSNLKEEVVACLLGGYGLKAELGLLAFHRIKNLRLICQEASYEDIEDAISAPFKWEGRDIHYRFSRQKAKYIYGFLQRNDIDEMEMMSGARLRERLMTVKAPSIRQ